VHAGCLAHARRKFDEALKAQKGNNTGRGGLAATGFLHIQGIYRVESEARERNLSPADRHLLRQEKARPLWEAMRSWLDQSLGAPLSTLIDGLLLAVSATTASYGRPRMRDRVTRLLQRECKFPRCPCALTSRLQ
jgi:Transposase IS66 family